MIWCRLRLPQVDPPLLPVLRHDVSRSRIDETRALAGSLFNDDITPDDDELFNVDEQIESSVRRPVHTVVKLLALLEPDADACFVLENHLHSHPGAELSETRFELEVTTCCLSAIWRPTSRTPADENRL
jgi:hypothetical protein